MPILLGISKLLLKVANVTIFSGTIRLLTLIQYFLRLVNMKLQTSNQNTSTLDKALGISLAAFSMFVVGYTVTRAYLSQPLSQNANTADSEILIPHEATLWSAVAN